MAHRILLLAAFLAATPSPAFADCAAPIAVANDGKDDRVAIQDALAKSGCVDLAPGVYDIGINPGVGLAGISTLWLKDGQSLRGSGPATVLRFGGKAHGDWNGIRMSGANTLVADLLIDDSALTGTSEQAHAIQVQGHASTIIGATTGATIRGVWFMHPVRHMPDVIDQVTGVTAAGASIPGGDCVRLLGEEATRVTVAITGNHFLDCDRSGIAIQRGAYGVIIAGNVFYRTGDQDIDVEMTGTGVGGDWSITGNLFLPGNQRSASVAFAGVTARHIAFSSNVMLGGGLSGYNLQHATIANNVIAYAVKGNTSAVVSFIKATDDVTMIGNTIIRTAEAGGGRLLSLEHHNTGSPGRLSVVGNSFVQQTKSGIATFVSAQDVLVTGNRFHYDAEAGASVGLSFSGVTRPVSRVLVEGNLFTGPLAAAVSVQSGADHVSVVGNLADKATVGLVCFLGDAIVSSGNNWAKNACVASAGM